MNLDDVARPTGIDALGREEGARPDEEARTMPHQIFLTLEAPEGQPPPPPGP